MLKQTCTEELRKITFNPKSQASYWMACNYYCTVKDLSEEEFKAVSEWYENALKEMNA